ncbi:sensor histidine kinase [Streptomyces sp. N50]|uniref:sensor histidine kinase n=1 Tax=Streptomyces sp. N50 TaxID=3081765 RepID=UPI0029624621|nr:histidine kinase [Streptomyces sp. N50]WOX15490.1 histidine kinase [Streptomyces sp. N50]
MLAGLIYLSIGSLAGLLLVPLILVSLVFRAAFLLLFVCPPLVLTLLVRSVTVLARWLPRSPGHDLVDVPRRHTLASTLARETRSRIAVLRPGLMPSLTLLHAVAELEGLLAGFMRGGTDGRPAQPRKRSAGEQLNGVTEAGWADIGYLFLLLLGTIWLIPLFALAVPVIAFAVSLPLGPPQQLAFGPGITVVVEGPVVRLLVAMGSLLVFGALMLLIFWMGKVRARMVDTILGRIDRAKQQRRMEAAERQRIAALRVNDADYRRLERDLHDGAQARLSVLLLRLTHVKRSTDKTLEELSEIVDEAHQEIGKALSEIRDLVHGIQPPILSDRGVDAAVAALTERFHVPVTVSSGLTRRPDVRVESTAYYIVAECLANAVKHASATSIHISLEEVEEQLLVVVTDDGVGGASPQAGTGLRGLADRATVLGGTVEVTSPQGGPTLVRAILPWSEDLL